MMHWIYDMPTFLSAFMASLVECVEALTVILAVGAVRGWRGALGGAGVALFVLLLLTALLGPLITMIPQFIVKIAFGTLILLFGLRWLRKAILRSAGIIPLHDEEKIYARESGALRAFGNITHGWDRLALAASFKITMIEGIEVVFIVIAVGAHGQNFLMSASLGAIAALFLVILLGLALHRPVSMIPENQLKFAVAVMLSAFGVFWLGEGVGLRWPGGDLALPALMGAFLAGALMLVQVCRRRKHEN